MIKKKFLINKLPENDLDYKENFDINVAKWLLEFSALIYTEDEQTILKELEKCKSFKLEKTIIVDNVECMILSKDDILIIAFSGTKIEELDDIITDVKFWYESFENFKIHKGFIDYYKKIKFSVLKKVIELEKQKERKIYWTGHSLGGALAVLFGFVYSKGVVYTFGQPKIGSREFSKTCDEKIKIYRIFNDIDLIPKLPPGFFKYYSPGKEILFKLNINNISIKNQFASFIAKIIENILFVFSLTTLASIFNSAFVISKGLSYHSLITYRKMLWSNMFKCYAEI